MSSSPARPQTGAFLAGAAALFLLAGYELARGPSQSLFLAHYDAQHLPWVMALSPVVTLAMVYGYGALLSRLGARRTLVATSLLSGLGLGAGYVGVSAGYGPATVVLYAFREAYVVLLIEQYWSFINSTLDESQARRVNGPICGIASIGAISGGLAVRLLATSVGTEGLVLGAALSTLPAALLGWLAYRAGGEPPVVEAKREGHGKLAIDLFGRYRTLRLVGAMVVITQVLATVLDIRFSGLLQVAYPDTDLRTAFLGTFWTLTNTATFALQFVLVPLVLRRVSLRRVHAALPAIHIAALAGLLLFPTLAVGAAAFLLFKALDYSLFRAAKEILYIPLPFDARYRAKEVIDAVGYRAAKGGIATGLGIAGAGLGALPGAVYPGLGLLAAGGWLALVLRYLRAENPAANE